MSFQPYKLNRRSFVVKSAVLAAGSVAAARWGKLTALAAGSETHQATGIKVGEVTDTSAIIWTRLTASSLRNNQGVVIKGKIDPNKPIKVTVPLTELEGACPGAPGRVRVRYGTRESLSRSRFTKWVEV
jgi:alkaline phosphatase D